MDLAAAEYLAKIDRLADDRRNEILQKPDSIRIRGTAYYVSNSGNDESSGLSPDCAWKTLSRVSAAQLSPGDGVFFRRGDIFRGSITAQSGVTYAAYGCGEKPRFYGWDRSLADPELWTLHNAAHNIWKLNERILDCGTIVFNNGERHCRKLIPSYRNGCFVCREEEHRLFDMAEEMTQDLDMVCFYDERLTTAPSKGQDFPIPLIDWNSYGTLYLRCDQGNPGAIFSAVEALPRRCMFRIGNAENVTVDNLCIRYIGAHAISAVGHVVGLHVSNCEIGWIGGAIQHYLGTDPNYPQGGRGTVTRYGNAIEVYGGCQDYQVNNCYIYQCYDAGITHQVTTHGREYRMENIRYRDNLIELCVYGIEYFLEKTDGDTASYMRDCEISGNMIRFSGYGWGQQRHNTDTPAHIKGWSYENTASDFRIHRNIFDRAAYRMLHLVAKYAKSCPQMQENTYIQHSGFSLGQYGENWQTEPENLTFDEKAEQKITDIFQDSGARVYIIE